MITNKFVLEKAKNLGFDLIGFTPVIELESEIEKLDEWLGKNYQAGMAYMEKNIEKRKNIKNILSSAKSVISLGLNYYNDGKFSGDISKGKISKYAWGTDYHLVLWDKLECLINLLREDDPAFEALSYVDTGPVMDKVWAVKAGLGWMGKHTNVISKEFGSWFFISTLITNFEFEYSEIITDHCGTCTRCLEACPTNAITEEYVVDANKCISYLTIENKREIPEEFKGKFDNWLFGCDICQEVCPWNNRFSVQTVEERFKPINQEISFVEVLNMDNSDFKQRYKESPILRAKLKGLQRNARFTKISS